MSVNIKYTVALFSALDVSVRNNHMRLARFSLHLARNRMAPYVANVHGNHYTRLSRMEPSKYRYRSRAVR